MKKLLQTAIKASIAAGKEIMTIYNKDFDVAYKKDQSPLTLADQNANAIINSFLIKTGIPIISEENKQTDYETRKNWDSCWMVDPLDGTKEFIKRNGEFTVNIALIKDQKPILGVIYVPVTKELFIGDVLNRKSYKVILTQHFDSLTYPEGFSELSPSFNFDGQNLRIVGSRSHMNSETEDFLNQLKQKGKSIDIVPKGSSLKFCLIAEGKADIYPRFAPTMEWDTAAGQAICEAVGIQVISTVTEKALKYNKENLLNPWFIVR